MSGFFDRAAALRLEFDRSFSEPVRADAVQRQAFLTIRAGAEPWAVRLDDVAGLFTDRQITPVPSNAPGLIGITGFRGTILAIYDLARLLGRGTSAPLRWLMTVTGAPVGFAFEAFDHLVSVSVGEVVLGQASGSAPVLGSECLLLDGLVLPIIHLPVLLGTVTPAATEC